MTGIISFRTGVNIPMSLLNKIVTQVKGAAHDLVDHVSDPSRTAHQLVRDLDEQLAQAEASLVDVETNYRVAEGKYTAAQGEVTKYSEGAARAVEKGNDALARQALDAKKRATADAASFKAQLDKQGPGLKALKDRIASLTGQRDDLARRADSIEARADMASAETRAAEIVTGIDTNGAIKGFSELEDQVARQEARAGILTDRADAASGSKLDAQLAALDQPSSSVDDELAELKKSMGKA